MVFYRTYRPQKIEDLDSENARETLKDVLSSKSVPHAFLFTGPKGLGKTSTARIVAKQVNCLKRGKNIEPCNKCEQCISITNGTNVDILEIDGASNRGIDEIRDLREKIRLAPLSSSWKVYIIDEVHMLTTEAFNALLKTLEEPPSHVMFILCTTEPTKVPQTIMSRCFHIAFQFASKDELIRSLARIAKGEKLQIDKEAFGEIAQLSDGSFRDGSKILEELTISLKGKKITVDRIQEKFKTNSTSVDKLLSLILKKEIKPALGEIAHLSSNGVDIKYFTAQLVNDLHSEMLKMVLENKKSEIQLSDVTKLIELLTRAHTEVKYAVVPQLPLELAIIEWGSLDSSSRLPHVAGDARPPQSEIQNASPSSLSESRRTQVIDKKPGSAFDSPASGQAPLAEFWKSLVDKVKRENHLLAGVLRSCSLMSMDNGKIIIQAQSKFHKERLEEEKSLSIVEKSSREITGKSVTIDIRLKGGDLK